MNENNEFFIRGDTKIILDAIAHNKWGKRMNFRLVQSTSCCGHHINPGEHVSLSAKKNCLPCANCEVLIESCHFISTSMQSHREGGRKSSIDAGKWMGAIGITAAIRHWFISIHCLANRLGQLKTTSEDVLCVRLTHWDITTEWWWTSTFT